MKYSICGFSQQELLNLNLDNTDALILDWFVYFIVSGKMAKETFDDKEYYWVKYEAVIKDLPCIGISNKEVMARRFNKFVKCGLMNKRIKKAFTGTYSMFTINPEVLDRLTYHPTQKSSVKDSEVECAPDPKVEPKDSTINNSTTNNKKIYNGEIKEVIDYLNEKADTNYRHTTNKTISLITTRLNEGFTVEDFKTVIDKKTEDWADDDHWCKFLRPETLFGTKFEGYLNQKDKQPVFTQYNYLN